MLFCHNVVPVRLCVVIEWDSKSYRGNTEFLHLPREDVYAWVRHRPGTTSLSLAR